MSTCVKKPLVSRTAQRHKKSSMMLVEIGLIVNRDGASGIAQFNVAVTMVSK